jgi:hypothetical protein
VDSSETEEDKTPQTNTAFLSTERIFSTGVRQKYQEVKQATNYDKKTYHQAGSW